MILFSTKSYEYEDITGESKAKYFHQYKLDDGEKMADVFNDLYNSDIEWISGYVDENVDGEMKSCHGSYSPQQIVEIIDELPVRCLFPEDTSCCLEGSYNGIEVTADINVDDYSMLYFYSTDKDIDLTDIVTFNETIKIREKFNKDDVGELKEIMRFGNKRVRERNLERFYSYADDLMWHYKKEIERTNSLTKYFKWYIIYLLFVIFIAALYGFFGIFVYLGDSVKNFV